MGSPGQDPKPNGYIFCALEILTGSEQVVTYSLRNQFSGNKELRNSNYCITE